MSCTTENQNNYYQEMWKLLMQLPEFRYMKEPVDTVQELYEKYPDGNERKSFAFVYGAGCFYYWNFASKEWKSSLNGIEYDGIETDTATVSVLKNTIEVNVAISDTEGNGISVEPNKGLFVDMNNIYEAVKNALIIGEF